MKMLAPRCSLAVTTLLVQFVMSVFVLLSVGAAGSSCEYLIQRQQSNQCSLNETVLEVSLTVNCSDSSRVLVSWSAPSAELIYLHYTCYWTENNTQLPGSYPVQFVTSSEFTTGSKYLNLSLSLTEGVHCIFSGCYTSSDFGCGYEYFPANVTCPVINSTSVTRSIISTPHRVPRSRTVSRILVTSLQQWPSSADHMTKYSELPTLTTATVPTQGTIGDSNKVLWLSALLVVAAIAFIMSATLVFFSSRFLLKRKQAPPAIPTSSAIMNEYI